MASVATQEYWDAHWQEVDFGIAPAHHPVRKWLESLPPGDGRSCLEIGCFPGKFLAVFGEKGYELHGVDFFPGTASALPRWLASRGYRTGQFHEEDFQAFDKGRYDVVSSFGFIEHFDDWRMLVEKHIGITKPGGTVIVEVPNLSSPIYRSLYETFEPSVLENHVLAAMDLDAICAVMERNGCDIVRADYVGDFYFRFVTMQGPEQDRIAESINAMKPSLDALPRSQSARYIGVMARLSGP